MAKLLPVLALLLLAAKLTSPLPNPYCLPQFSHANWLCASVLFDKPANSPSSDEDVRAVLHRFHRFPGTAATQAHRRGRRARREVSVADDNDDSLGDEQCCRALEEVDNECVCNALARLPLFLSVAEHDYTIKVGTHCNVTFECGVHGNTRMG